MAWTGLDQLNDTGLKGILQFPTIGFPYFWEFILLTLFVIGLGSSYFSQKDRVGRSNFISSAGVWAIILIILSTLIRLLELISREMQIMNFVLGMIFIALWMLTDN